MNHLLIRDFITTSRKLKKLIFDISDIDANSELPTILQYHALCYINNNDNVSVGMLGSELAISSGGVAQLIDRLLTKKWIIKEVDKADKRISILIISKTGAVELKKVKKKYKSKLQKVLKFVEEDDLKTLIKIQKKILTNIQQDKNKP